MTHGSSGRLVVSLFALAGLTAQGLAAQTQGVVAVDPTWLRVDSASRSAEFTLIAGLTPANAGMNFNGATAGAVRFSVPVGWHVVLHFRNADPNLPHSAEVIPADTALPTGAVPPVFVHAATGQMVQGLPSGAHEDVRFIAEKAGAYLIGCPVQGHGSLGMWIRFDVTPTIAPPTVTAAKQGAPQADRPAPAAAQGPLVVSPPPPHGS